MCSGDHGTYHVYMRQAWKVRNSKSFVVDSRNELRVRDTCSECYYTTLAIFPWNYDPSKDGIRHPPQADMDRHVGDVVFACPISSGSGDVIEAMAGANNFAPSKATNNFLHLQDRKCVEHEHAGELHNSAPVLHSVLFCQIVCASAFSYLPLCYARFTLEALVLVWRPWTSSVTNIYSARIMNRTPLCTVRCRFLHRSCV